MNKAWIAAFVAVVIAIFGIAWGYTQYQRAERNAEHASRIEGDYQNQLEQASTDLDEALRKLAEERDRLSRAEIELARRQTEQAPAIEAIEDVPSEPGLMAMFGEMADGMPGGPPPGFGGDGPEEGGPFGGFRNMFEGERGREMARMGARMTINMQYGDFFDEAGLSPNQRGKVEEIIESMTMDQMTAAMDMWGEDMDMDAMRRMQEFFETNLRYELSKELNPNQLALWDHYEDTKEERMLTGAMDMQLGMFARGLTPENRSVVAETLAQEMRSANIGNPMAGMQDPGAALDAQLDAYYRTRDRLAQTLDQEQLAEYDRFITQMENTMEMQRQFMDSMMQPDND